MIFRTEIQSENRGDFFITHQSKIITIGSCFSDVIGKKLAVYKFNTLINPFGTVFNPVSIAKLLLNNFEPNFIQREGRWLSFSHHSNLSADNEGLLLKLINEQSDSVQKFLIKADVLIVTLGTAYVHVYKEKNEVVANCHKAKAELFEKKMLRLDEVFLSLDELVLGIQKINPKCKILLTVSPVRHIKDTLLLNSVSKSTLRVACHYLTQKYDHVHYFPAFEIMNDDLRDYRFYKQDLIHPSEMAEEYIWENFVRSMLSFDTQAFIVQWKSILQAMEHKPFNPNATEYQNFLKANLSLLQNFEPKGIDISKERAHFEQFLS